MTVDKKMTNYVRELGARFINNSVPDVMPYESESTRLTTAYMALLVLLTSLATILGLTRNQVLEDVSTQLDQAAARAAAAAKAEQLN